MLVTAQQVTGTVRVTALISVTHTLTLQQTVWRILGQLCDNARMPDSI